MATKSPVYCRLCNETISPDGDLEHHLVYRHKPRELARRLAAAWEAEELGDAVRFARVRRGSPSRRPRTASGR